MSGITIGQEVNSFFLGEVLTPKICYDLWDVLFKHGHINHLVKDAVKVESSRFYIKEMLSLICMRTLGFGKPFEYIANGAFSEETKETGMCNFGMSESTVTRGMATLVKSKLVIVFTDGYRRYRFIGLDFYNIVVRLYSWLKKCTNESFQRVSKARSIVKGLIQSKPFMRLARSMQSLCGISLPKNSGYIERELESMTKLGDVLLSVNNRAKTLEHKRDVKAALEAEAATLVVKVADKDAKNFLVNWKKLIIESGMYPQYDHNDEIRTPNLLSRVKSFLSAEYADGKSWEELRADLLIVIDGWGRIPSKKRKLTGISKNGKPYTVDLKPIPDFVMYYEHRASIRQLCRAYSVIGKKGLVDDLLLPEPLTSLPPESSEKSSINI